MQKVYKFDLTSRNLSWKDKSITTKKSTKIYLWLLSFDETKQNVSSAWESDIIKLFITLPIFT